MESNNTVNISNANSFGWIGLCGFLLVILLIITIFYSYILVNRIDPNSCPKSIGDYGVLPGQTGLVLNTCDGPCEFLVPSLYNAATKCDGDSRCQSFYYDGIRMMYIDPASALLTAIQGGLYIRQRNLIS